MVWAFSVMIMNVESCHGMGIYCGDNERGVIPSSGHLV